MFYTLEANENCIRYATPNPQPQPAPPQPSFERVGMDRWLTTTQGIILACILSITLLWAPAVLLISWLVNR